MATPLELVKAEPLYTLQAKYQHGKSNATKYVQHLHQPLDATEFHLKELLANPRLMWVYVELEGSVQR